MVTAKLGVGWWVTWNGVAWDVLVQNTEFYNFRACHRRIRYIRLFVEFDVKKALFHQKNIECCELTNNTNTDDLP